MEERVHYTQCPVCGSGDFHTVLKAKDHTVSGEEFAVAECRHCTLRFTLDPPGPSAIGVYYQSEAYISHSDTAKGVVNKLYQAVRKRTIRQKRKLVEKSTGLQKGNLLDIGSGTGVFAAAMQEAGWSVTGLEPDSGARDRARQLHGVELEDSSRLFELPPSSYDAITLWHVLEHVHDLQGYMRQLKLLLKDTGKLIIAVPNYTSKDAAIYGADWAAWDVPRHLYHFSPASMQVLLANQELILESTRPMWYDSYYVAMLSSKYRHGKTNMAGAVFNGWRSNSKAWSDNTRCSSVIYIAHK